MLLARAEGSEGMGALPGKAPLLKKLDAHGADVIPTAFPAMAKSAPNDLKIETLDFNGSDRLLAEAESGEAMGALLGIVPLLKELNASSTGLTAMAFSAMVKSAPRDLKMEKFYVSSNHSLLAEAQGCEAMGTFLGKAPMLKELPADHTDALSRGFAISVKGYLPNTTIRTFEGSPGRSIGY